jgi:hypothetical protein
MFICGLITINIMSITKKIFVGAFFAFFALVASSANAAYTHTGLLKMGMSSSQVMSLQQTLNAHGFLVSTTGAGSPGMESMYFGSKTKAAVMAFQSAKGLIPVDGIVGIDTGTALAANSGNVTPGPLCPNGNTVASSCTTPPGGTQTGPTCPNGNLISNNCLPAGGNGGLSGTDGEINDVTELSQYASEDVGEGQEDVKVLGMDVEASNDGDIQLKSIRVSLDSTGNSGSDNLDDYIESVSVWMGSTEVGSADVDEFNEDGNVWSKTITLDSSAVIDADETAKFYVSVSAQGNFDSSDISGDSWTIDVDSIRFVDGSGVVTTDDSTGDIDGMDVPIDFVSFSSAANTELKVSTDSTSPEAGIVVIDDTEDTEGVSLLKGKIEAEGDSDVVIDELPFTLTTVGGANVAAVTGSVTLKIDGEEYTESVTISGATTGTVTFDNLDLTIEAGDTVEFEVLADINDIDAGNLDEGDTLVASLTSTNRDYIDAENEEGDQLSDSTEKSGTATGEAQEFRTNGIMLTWVSAATSVAAGTSTNDDQGTFTLKFKVTAIGDTAYVSSLADATLSGVTTGKTSVLVDRAGTATVGGTSVTIANLTDTDLNAAGLYEIEEGESETFEVTTTVQLPTSGAAGQFRVVLGGVSWDTDSADATPDNAYTSNLDAFKTSYVGLN